MKILVPVTSLVKKVILYKEGIEPILVRLDSVLGRVVHSSVGKGKSNLSQKELDKYNDSLEIALPESIKTYTYNRVKLSLLNGLYYQIFKDDMFLYIKAQREAGLNIREAIENFLKHYGVEENEYTPETARREWNRHCNKQKEAQEKK